MPTYNPLTRGYWTFQQTLDEEVSGADFTSDGSITPSYQKYRRYNPLTGETDSKYGVVFGSDTWSSTVGSFDVGDYQCSVGFWYYSPAVLGFTRHVTTRQLMPMMAPIIAKADTKTRFGIENVTSGKGEWIITEVGYSDTENAIQVAFCNNNNDPSVEYLSLPFTPGLHHVYMTADIRTTKIYVRIDIDGNFGYQHVRTSGFTIGNTTASLRLNDIGYGPTAHKTTQTGAYVSDLYAVADTNMSGLRSLLSVRFGANQVLTEDNKNFSYLGMGYKQPTTVTTNHIFADGGSIFAARSDGEIVKAHRGIWDIEYSYIYPQSLTRLTFSERDDNRTARWTSKGLALKGTTVRI